MTVPPPAADVGLDAVQAADLRRWRACARQHWWHRREHASAGTDALPARAGTDAETTGEAAVVRGPGPMAALRACFPGALTVPAPATPADWPQALAHTRAALADARLQQPGRAVLGACLASDDGALVRIDVLVRGDHGLRLFKLRWATVADEADGDEAALCAHVAARCGLRVQSVGLLLVDTDFVYPGLGCHGGLLREVDLGPTLGTRPVARWLVALRRSAREAEPPPQPGAACTGCGQAARCGVAPPPRRADALTVVGRELAEALQAEGHHALTSVPEHRLTHPRHRRAWRAVHQRRPVLEPDVHALMRQIEHQHGSPRRVLRIDTIGFAVPVWPGTRPYQVVPYQWTCSTQRPDGTWHTLSWLAGAQGDPRRTFVATLLGAAGTRGPVYAYNAGFERNRLRELARQFDDLARPLEALLERIVDLFQIAREHYYHPAMCGSWSFRAIAGAVAPDLGEPGLRDPIADSAASGFAMSLQPELPPASRERLRGALEDHGHRQVAVLQHLVALFTHAPAEGTVALDQPQAHGD